MNQFSKKSKMHVKKGDLVVAISGEDAATKKTGKVLQVFPEKGRVLVEGFNLVKKTMRKSQDNPKGGIVEKEAPMAASKLKVQNSAGERAAKK